jgi:D-tyrosyl-tRNA(Tyr) deacylase
MRAVLQRVSSASVTIDDVVTASISRGLLIFVAVQHGDDDADALWLANKIAGLRVFADENGRMNRSLKDLAAPTAGSPTMRHDVSGSARALIVSQFTLLANTSKGSRPSFNEAAPPEAALRLYQLFVHHIEANLGGSVATGEFGTDMQVSLVNEGPVTIIIDSPMHR